jgi:Zn-dependent protease with chaperone function
VTAEFATRGLVQVLSAYAVTSTLATVAVAFAWRFAASACDDPRRRADWLFALRLLPATLGAAVALSAVAAYLAWEPRGHDEAIGPLAWGCAIVGGAMLLSGLGRAAMSIRRSRTIARRLSSASCGSLDGLAVAAWRIDTPFPIVAMVGLVKPGLFVAGRVIDSCTREELEVVLAHEMAHRAAHDNLRRLLVVSAPDPLAWTPFHTTMTDQWALAAESAADERAAGPIEAHRLHLASALVKVARLAASPAPQLASALYGTGPIGDRVRNLVVAPGHSRPPMRGLFLLSTIGAALVGVAAMPAVRAALERLIAIGR